MNPILKYLSGDTRRMGIVLETRDDSKKTSEDCREPHYLDK